MAACEDVEVDEGFDVLVTEVIGWAREDNSCCFDDPETQIGPSDSSVAFLARSFSKFLLKASKLWWSKSFPAKNTAGPSSFESDLSNVWGSRRSCEDDRFFHLAT